MIQKVIKNIARHLDKNGIPYMIIGGQAVLLYGTPRLTRDVDITLGIDVDELFLIEAICKKLKLKILVDNPRDFANETKVLPAEETKLKIRVDFIFSFTFYETQAIKRSKKVWLAGYPVRFASREDVIVHKMFGGRAIDEEDVKGILIKHRNRIDFAYIKKWLSEFGKLSEQRGILFRFETLLKQTMSQR